MADPLSTVASLIAIVQLSSKIVSVCNDYCSAVNKSSKQQKELADDVKSLRDALEGLIKLAKQDSSGPASLPMIDALNRKDGPFEHIRVELQNLEAKLLPVKGWKSVGKAIRRPLAEPEVTKSFARVNRLNTAVLLAVTEDQNALSLKIQRGMHRVETRAERTAQDFEAIHESEERQQVMTWLSAPDPSPNQRISRSKMQDGTGLWLINSQEFVHWKSIPGSLLWLHGIPGCGKTVLSSHIVDNITQDRQSRSSIGVAYFYFDVSNDLQQRADHFLRSAIAQLSSQSPHSMRSLFEYHRHATLGRKDFSPEEASTSDLLTLFRSNLDCFDSTYVVLDALDECRNREELLKLLDQIAKWRPSKVNLLMTSRTERDIEDKMQDLDVVKIGLHGATIEADIRTYVEQILKTDTRLKKWNGDLKSEIQDVLLDRAQNMFRWVECQVDVLRRCLKPQAVKKTLQSLPMNLTETYDNMVSSIQLEYFDDARRILQFLAFAHRPMQLAEIAEVLAVDWENDPKFDPANRIPDVRDILTVCSILITITASDATLESSEVRLAHSTVKEYLTSPSTLVGSRSKQAIKFNHDDSHHFIATTCLAYLLHFDTGHAFALTANESYSLAEYAAKYWVAHYHVASDKDGLQRQIFQLFQGRKGCFVNWQKIYNIDKPWTYSHRYNSSPMASPLYCASLMELDTTVRRLLQNGVDPDEEGGILGSALGAAVYKGNMSIVRMLLENGSNPDFRGGILRSPLIAACVKGQKEIVVMLLEKGADIEGWDFLQGHPLFVAAEHGHEDIVRQLLDLGADVNLRTGKKGSALHAAVVGGHESICRLLVGRGADIKNQYVLIAAEKGLAGIVNFFLAQGIPSNQGILASAAKGNLHGVVEQLIGQGVNVEGTLQSAAKGGSLTIVQRLLDSGANVDFIGPHIFDGTALVVAAEAGYDSVVQLLLSYKADINAQGDYWGTALHAAARNGHFSIVRLLLERTPPANVNTRGCLHTNTSYYGTVLQNAVRSGKLALVKYLLDKGADINAHGEDFGFALETASSHAYLDIVRLLLARGADINMNVGRFGSALHRAAASGDIAMTRELLDHGADPKALGGDYVTAVEAAAHVGYAAIVRLLLQYGAEPEIRGTPDQVCGSMSTGALGIAARKGYIMVVHLLLDAGANPDLANGYSLKTPVEEAAAAGQLRVMSAFIDHGASVKSSSTLNHAMTVHWSPNDNIEMVRFLLDNGAHPDRVLDSKESLFPLQLAARYGRKSIIRVLLEHGADVNRQIDDGWTALHEAAKNGDEETVRLLIENYNADITKPSVNGSLALHLAAQNGHTGCVRALLDKGQNINATNNDGRTALHIAASDDCVEVVRYLLERGADITIQDSVAAMTVIDIAEFKLAEGGSGSRGARDIIEALQTQLQIGEGG